MRTSAMTKLSGWINAAVLSIALIAASYAPWLPTTPAAQASGGPAYKTGTIAAKGLVLGEHGKPIWAEFDAAGNVVRQIGEAVGELENATVMPAGTYRAYVNAFNEIEAAHRAHRRILYRDEYLSTPFELADGTAVSAPPLKNDTWSVVVRTKDAFYDRSMGLVLHESPLDLLRLQAIPDSARAVLLGEDRRVITTAEVNIGYAAAFYTPQDAAGTSQGQNSLGGYQQGQDTLWGPIAGAKVETSMSRFPGFSDESGRYVASYFIPPCPGFFFDYTNNIFVELRYQNFDPNRKSPFGAWYEWRPGYDYCVGYSEGFLTPTLAGLATKINLMGIEAGMAKPINRVDFSIDVAMLTGQAIMRNEPRPDIPLAAEIVGAIPLAETTEYAYVEPLFAAGQTSPIRQPDIEPDFSDQGLLKTISKDDLENTDLYIYRVSNGQLITSRKGLRPDEAPRRKQSLLRRRRRHGSRESCQLPHADARAGLF